MHGWQPHIPAPPPLSSRSKMYLLLNPRPRSRHVHSPAELKVSVCWVLNYHISFIFAQPANPPRSQKRKQGADRPGTPVQPLNSHCLLRVEGLHTAQWALFATSGTVWCPRTQEFSAQIRAALVAEDDCITPV